MPPRGFKQGNSKPCHVSGVYTKKVSSRPWYAILFPLPGSIGLLDTWEKEEHVVSYCEYPLP